jgi:hypothetical protein
MRNLKYLQLFEAFESQRLSKTLKFINQGARENFMESLNRISKRFDFPISKFNDDMFEYLPFKSALKKNVAPPKEPEKEVCNRESDWIPGDFCQGGRVKRTWGAHTRMTECPGCGGTGFKPLKKATPEVSIVKFWFDKDGNWVTVTGCDGIIRSQNTKKIKYVGSDLYHFSKDVNDYNKLRQIDFNELLGLSTGTIVNFREPEEEEEYAVSMVLNDESKVFLLQNLFPGSSPEEYGLDYDWKAYADCSWIVTSRANFGSAFLLEPKDKKVDNVKKEIKEFPQEVAYEWNNFIDLRYMQMSSHRDMEERLKNAHFAIILDINKLKESEFQKLSLTKSERELRKVGAFLKPEDVKGANIERYMNLIVKKFDANKGLSELTKVLPRAFGYTNILTFILRGYNFNNLDSLITYLNSFMRNPSDYNLNQVLYNLKSVYDSARDRSQNINKTTDSIWKLLDKGRGDKSTDERAKKYFQTYLEISEFLFKKLSSEKIETLGDIELVMNKLRVIKQFIENTRFETLRRFVRYIAEYLGGSRPDYVIGYIYEALEDYTNAEGELEEFKRVIEKTF